MPTVYSPLAEREVDTYSEEFRHLCECEYILAMPDRETRINHLYGIEELVWDPKKGGSRTRVISKGIAHHRGLPEADRIKADCWKLLKVKQACKSKT